MSMNGPDLIARTMSVPSIQDEHGNLWQYHSRSDRHSKVACWATMFDLLQHSALLTRHVAEGKVAFGVNHEFADFRTRRKKKLDLVIHRPGSAADGRMGRTFTDLGTSLRSSSTTWNVLRSPTSRSCEKRRSARSSWHSRPRHA
jgi:hypothetical protein